MNESLISQFDSVLLVLDLNAPQAHSTSHIQLLYKHHSSLLLFLPVSILQEDISAQGAQMDQLPSGTLKQELQSVG
jgi:hypothetical protein